MLNIFFKSKWSTILNCVKRHKCPSFISKRIISTDLKNNDTLWKQVFYWSAFTLGVVILTTDRFVSCTGVTGRSMQPTINPDELAFKDWVILDKRPAKDYSLIKRGDVVTYKTLHNPDEINIKRVVALEGDSVKTLGYKKRIVRIPTGYCWVEGDNHTCSDDSNKRGPIPLGLITGRASFVMFPPSRWQALERKFPHNRVKVNPNSDASVKMLSDIESPTDIYERRR